MFESLTSPITSLTGEQFALFGLLFVWTMIWKGIALWKSAGLRQKKWFVVLLVINTFGILEIIYIYFVAKKYSVEVINREN
jgi:hypothetical protein